MPAGLSPAECRQPARLPSRLERSLTEADTGPDAGPDADGGDRWWSARGTPAAPDCRASSRCSAGSRCWGRRRPPAFGEETAGRTLAELSP
ncbi:hypothetical protein [Streptomyces lydicus]|uniref:hypothetical protein n=1 Tax=Streptomyces lydicus TaxID=47763 RepID=UPI0018FE0B35|nr:hypothetical protein [Streptomyces lydicus]